MSDLTKEYPFLSRKLSSHPFPDKGCSIAELKYIELLSSSGSDKPLLVPRDMSLRKGLLQSVNVTVLDKPRLYGVTSSLVIRSSDPKYLGAIVDHKTPLRIFYGNAVYQDRLPPGVYMPDEFAGLRTNLEKLNLPYPSHPGVLLYLLGVLLNLSEIKYDDGLMQNISSFSRLYEASFPNSTSGIWPLANRDNL